MALTRPFINSIPAFDATQSTIAVLSVKGGDAITGYKFKITSNDGLNTLIYESANIPIIGTDIASETIRSFNININPTTMNIVNYNSYKIQALTYNATETSAYSLETIFYCYKTPNVTLQYRHLQNGVAVFSDLVTGSVINDNNPTFRLLFSNEYLNSRAKPNIGDITIYGVLDSGDETIIYYSQNIYNFTRTNNQYSLEFTVSGFSRNIDASGALLSLAQRKFASFKVYYNLYTIENMVITNTINGINCYYDVIDNTQFLTVSNICNKGVIQLTCSLTNLEGSGYPDPPVYIDDKEVDLTADGSYAQWQGLFSLSNDYTLRIWGRSFNEGIIALISSSTTANKNITLYYQTKDVVDETTQTTTNYTYIALESMRVNNNGENMYPYYIESQLIETSTITADTKLFIGVQEQQGLFDLGFEKI